MPACTCSSQPAAASLPDSYQAEQQRPSFLLNLTESLFSPVAGDNVSSCCKTHDTQLQLPYLILGIGLKVVHHVCKRLILVDAQLNGPLQDSL